MASEDIDNNELTVASVLAFIDRFTEKLASTTDLETLYRHCVSLPKEIFQLDHSELLLLDDYEEKLVVKAADGILTDLTESDTLTGREVLPDLALKTGRIETVDDFSSESRFEIPSFVTEHKVCSAIAVPIVDSSVVSGVLVGYTLRKKSFSKDERQFYRLLASQASAAISKVSPVTSSPGDEKNGIEEEIYQDSELTDEFESIFSAITSGVMLLKDGRDIIRCNEKMAEIFGFDSTEELCNMKISELHLSEEDLREFGRKNYGNLVAGKVVRTEYTLMKKDGTPILCRLSGRAVDQSSPPDLKKGFVWLIDDITRRKAMEREILQARKLESIGIMAGGIGHDFNNILSAILGNLELARRMLEPEHQVQELLSSAVEASNRAKDLTAKLLLFTRREGRSIGNIYLQEIFIEYKFEKMVGSKTSLQLEFADDLAPIRIMPDHLKAIIQNLLINADSCMVDGGKICVTAKNVEIDDESIPGLSGGRYVQIKVADTGSGIETDILENIFDPYFTTKDRDSNRGSGLGLAIVHSIVKKNYGSISVRSSKEEGTVFTILLPAVVTRQQ